MDENNGIFDYLTRVMVVFGFSMLVLNIFCVMFGDSAQGLSSMFAMGSRGLPVEMAFQYLAISALIVGMRFLFFTDRLIKNMAMPMRTVCMLGSVVLIAVVFIICFQWFPVDMWQAWAMFLLCFVICFLGSYFVMLLKEKTENRKLNDALSKLKKKEGSEHE